MGRGAYDIREILNKEHRVTVINEREDFQFVPSNPWIAVGWRERPEISFPIRPHLEKKSIEFIASAVVIIDPQTNQLSLQAGASYQLPKNISLALQATRYSGDVQTLMLDFSHLIP